MKAGIQVNKSRVVGIVEKTYQLLMINICFFLTTLPLMIAFIILKPTIFAIPFYLLGSIPLGPSLFSVVHCLEKINEEKEIPVFSVYFKNWRKVFKKSSLMTTFLVLVIVVGVVDLQFFSTIKFLQWLNPLVILLIAMAVIVYSNALFLYTKQKLPLKELLKLASYSSFKQLFISLVNGLLLTVLILAMIIKPAIGFLIFPSLLMAVLLWNSQKLVSCFE